MPRAQLSMMASQLAVDKATQKNAKEFAGFELMEAKNSGPNCYRISALLFPPSMKMANHSLKNLNQHPVGSLTNFICMLN